MKRLFIIGASILQLPAIKKAKELGYYVGVADYNSRAVGIAYADEYFNVSTNDQEGIYEAAKAFGADDLGHRYAHAQRSLRLREVGADRGFL